MNHPKTPRAVYPIAIAVTKRRATTGGPNHPAYAATSAETRCSALCAQSWASRWSSALVTTG